MDEYCYEEAESSTRRRARYWLDLDAYRPCCYAHGSLRGSLSSYWEGRYPFHLSHLNWRRRLKFTNRPGEWASGILKRAIPVLSILLLLTLGLAAWTLESPPILSIQSADALRNSIFSSARNVVTRSITDGAGSYLLAFGFDVPDVALPMGSRIQFRIYAALLAQHIASPFARGISLSLDGLSLFIDNAEDSAVKVVTQTGSNLVTYELQSPNTNLTLGLHKLFVHLVFSTIDVNYIGYSRGSSGIVPLSGNLTISQ